MTPRTRAASSKAADKEDPKVDDETQADDAAEQDEQPENAGLSAAEEEAANNDAEQQRLRDAARGVTGPSADAQRQRAGTSALPGPAFSGELSDEGKARAASGLPANHTSAAEVGSAKLAQQESAPEAED
jgi:hypothetical protein